jgi:hypothetical protein
MPRSQRWLGRDGAVLGIVDVVRAVVDGLPRDQLIVVDDRYEELVCHHIAFPVVDEREDFPGIDTNGPPTRMAQSVPASLAALLRNVSPSGGYGSSPQRLTGEVPMREMWRCR